MNTLKPITIQKFEDTKKLNEEGVEYWEARSLMPLLGYDDWKNFIKVIEKAKQACILSGQSAEYHFSEFGKMIRIAANTPKETKREIQDFYLSRYACYLIAQNGNAFKPEIATAQTYFAIQTHRQELNDKASEEDKRLYVRSEVTVQNKKLFSTAKQAGVHNFGKFNDMGYRGLYGLTGKQIQKKKDIGSDSILDRAGATELAANLFRITQTDEKIKREQIKGEGKASIAHLVVGNKVREAIKDLGGTMPENMLPEEHIKLIEKKHKIRSLNVNKHKQISRGK